MTTYQQYVHTDSKHPRYVLKNIPLTVNKRLNEISCNKKMFSKHAPDYQSAIDKSGYAHKYTATLDHEIDEKKKRKTRRSR